MEKAEKRIAIVYANFNPAIVEPMLKAALAVAEQENLVVLKTIEVPGAFEIPFAVQKLFLEKEIGGVVCLGAILKGATDHDQVIGFSVAKSLQELSLQFQKPVGFGIIGPGANESQARERAVDFAARSVLAVKRLLSL